MEPATLVIDAMAAEAHRTQCMLDAVRAVHDAQFDIDNALLSIVKSKSAVEIETPETTSTPKSEMDETSDETNALTQDVQAKMAGDVQDVKTDAMTNPETKSDNTNTGTAEEEVEEEEAEEEGIAEEEEEAKEKEEKVDEDKPTREMDVFFDPVAAYKLISVSARCYPINVDVNDTTCDSDLDDDMDDDDGFGNDDDDDDGDSKQANERLLMKLQDAKHRYRNKKGVEESEDDEDEDNDDDDYDDETDDETDDSEDDDRHSRRHVRRERNHIDDAVCALSPFYAFCGVIHAHSHVVVYQAVDKQTNEIVCVKIGMRRRLARISSYIHIEARILARLTKHVRESSAAKHLQQFRAYWSSKHCYAIVSTYHEECSFSEALHNNLDKQRRMLHDLLIAVSHVHAAGLIHRDIKPSNILYNDEEEVAVLCDYDLATFDRVEGHKSVLGTDGFIAPETLVHEHKFSDKEQKKNKKKKRRKKKKAPPSYGKTVDVFALGMTFGCVLFGVDEVDVDFDTAREWRAKAKRRLKRKTGKRQPYDHACDLLARMLAHNSSQRITVTDALNHPFFASLRHSAGSSSQDTPGTTKNADNKTQETKHD